MLTLNVNPKCYVNVTLNVNPFYHFIKNEISFSATFELQSFGTSIIRIKNLATNYYLTMKKNGLFTGNVSIYEMFTTVRRG